MTIFVHFLFFLLHFDVVLVVLWCSQAAQKWGTDEVVAWLEREGLGSLCSIAREQGLDGSILLALFKVCTDSLLFGADCTGLGISGLPLQLKLKGKLVALFG